jgi:hypothetical protein
MYLVNITVGTPPQSVRLRLDTSSSDLWVNTPTSALCAGNASLCSFGGTYTANSSSTYSYVSSDFNLSFVDGTGTSGDYVLDTITIGSATVPSLQFGIGYTSSIIQGILGIGYDVEETQVQKAGKAAYNNLPAQMAANGIIQSNAYSLWLNDQEASTGTILFGGVDTAHYHGSLETLPIQKDAGLFAGFFITLTQVDLGSVTIAKNQALAVRLDSGSSITYLPDAMAEAIFQEVGAVYQETAGYAVIPCSQASSNLTLNFTFSLPTIAISMKELVISGSTDVEHPGTLVDGTPLCIFGIAPALGTSPELGDTFMRSAYLVFDLSNNEISIAQTDFNATSTNLVEIGTGPGAVSYAKPVPNAVTASTFIGDNLASASTATPTAKVAPTGLGGATLAEGGGERTKHRINFVAAIVLYAGAWIL